MGQRSKGMAGSRAVGPLGLRAAGRTTLPGGDGGREPWWGDLRHNPRAPFALDIHGGTPLSGKRSTTSSTRRGRRAQERQRRFDSARDERRARAAGRSTSSSDLFTTRNITIVAVIVGVLVVAFVAFNQLGGKSTASSASSVQDPGIEYPVALQKGNALGEESAPVTLQVWEDLQCPVCAQYDLSVEPVLVTKYVTPGTLRIVHHDIAILGRGGADDESKLAAAGATCAMNEGAYWDYIHKVYDNQDGENAGAFTRDRLAAIAEAAGVDGTKFRSCIDAPATVQAVADTTTQAVNGGINQTPTMTINGQKVVGLRSADALGQLIEQAAASAAPSGGASQAPASPAASASAAP